MVEIIPAILEKDIEQIAEKFKKVEGLVEHVQLDVMDDVFVPNMTFNDPARLSEIPGDVKIEIHFMIENPVEVVKDWIKDERVDRALFHFEGLEDPKATIKQLKELPVEIGVAINPDTDVTVLEPLIDLVDMVLVMGVPPGFSGQTLDVHAPERIAAIQAMDPSLQIEVDGGVTPENIDDLAAAGATHIVTAHAIFSKPNIKKAIQKLRDNAHVH